VRQGLAFELYNGDLAREAPHGVVPMGSSPYVTVTGDWLDAPRTRQLLDRAFVHHAGIPDRWDHWPDQASVGIPNYYAWAYLSLTVAAAREGDEATTARYRERTEAWTTLGS
jgi:hypothetical protein